MDYFISNALKQRRHEASLSQEELAARAELDVRTIRRIESNKGVSSNTLKKVCNVLKIGFKETDTEEILSEFQAIRLPNVKSGRDLAHLLIHCYQLDYYSDPASRFGKDESQVMEDFMETILEMMEIFSFVNVEDRRFFIERFDEELKGLVEKGFFIYGSCNDTLTNEFKMTELVFSK